MVAEFISTQLKDNDIEPSEIKKFWLHQANARMINLIVAKIIGTEQFDTSLAPMPIEKFGNLASAGLCLHSTYIMILKKVKKV